MFSSEHNKLDMFEAMQGGKVVLVLRPPAVLSDARFGIIGLGVHDGPCGDAPKAARNQEQRTLILECSHPKWYWPLLTSVAVLNLAVARFAEIGRCEQSYTDAGA
jgi:hypothetical protein